MKKIKYIYIGNRNGSQHNGIVTIGYRFIENTLQYAVSFCNKKDRFNKKIGRNIIEGRFNKNIFEQVDISEDNRNYEYIKRYIILQLQKNKKYFANCKVPSWVKKVIDDTK
jgi:hypothetical protein